MIIIHVRSSLCKSAKKNHRQTYKLLIGSITRGSNLSSGAFEVTSDVSYAHEKFSQLNLQNDIALVQLPEEVTLTGMLYI
jgi:hypothetical protein